MGLLLEAPEQGTDEAVKDVKAPSSLPEEPTHGEEGQESDPKQVAEEQKQKDDEETPSKKEIDQAAKSTKGDADKPKKKLKKKGKKKNPDGTVTKKTKKKKKKPKKKTVVKQEAESSSKAIEGDDQDMAKSANNTTDVVSSDNELQQDDVVENQHEVLPVVDEEAGTMTMEDGEPQVKVYGPILVSQGSLSSPKKPDSFSDTESIFSKKSEFEQAWREADNSKHNKGEEKQEEPVPEDEALSLAETILDSAASGGESTFNSHGQFAVISNGLGADEKAKDLRRQAISLAAAETRRQAEARNRKMDASDRTVQSRNSSTAQLGKRLPDDDDGTEQPESVSSSARIIPREQEGKQAYMEGVKTASIVDTKRYQPGAFCVTGPNDVASNPAGNEDNDVLVAAVTEEDEAKVEERVMQRLLKETAKASVILVEHGGNSKKYEDPIAEAERQAELENYKPQGLVEKMFGDGKVTVDVGAAPDDLIKRRNHIPFTIKLHGTTNLWVTSIQTSQKAWDSSQYMYEKTSLELKRSIKTYIATTEQEAYEIGLAMAPPIMNSFDENPICQLCSR